MTDVVLIDQTTPKPNGKFGDDAFDAFAKCNDNFTALGEADTAEAQARAAADQALTEAINALPTSGALQDEVNARIAADNALGVRIDGSATAAALAAEVTARGDAVAAEALARTNADNALQTAINNVRAKTGRSKIINGNFDIWQNGLSFNSIGYAADQWYIEMGAITNPSFARSTVGPGNPGFKSNPKYCAQIDYTANTNAASHYFIAHQRVEDVRTFSGQSCVVSFTIFNAGAAGRQIAVEFIRSYGTGGSASETGISPQKFTLAAGFNYIQVPVTFASVIGKTIGANSYINMGVWFTAGTNFNSRTANLGAQVGQLLLGEVQWEEGDTATAYEWQPESKVVADCLRYFEKSYDLGVTPGTAGAVGFENLLAAASGYFLSGGVSFKVTKRTTPSIAVWAADGQANTMTEVGTTGSVVGNKVASVTNQSQKGFEVRSNGTATAGNVERIHWAADARL